MVKSRRNTYYSLLLVWDFFSVSLSVALALRLRFGFIRHVPEHYLNNQGLFILVSLGFTSAFFILLGVYYHSARPVSTSFVIRSCAACMLVSLSQLLSDRIYRLGVPFEVPLSFGLLLFFFIILGRFGLTFIRELADKLSIRRRPGLRRAAIYGAGELGIYLAHKLEGQNSSNLVPIIFIDDDKNKKNQRIQGIKVAGIMEDLPALTQWYNLEEVVIAINTLPPERVAEVVSKCRGLGLSVRRFGLTGGLNDINLAKLSEIPPEELLHRQSVSLDMEAVQNLIEGHTVLVTGGAGSIGSEICNQVLKFGAAKVIIYDIHENGLFELGAKLADDYNKERYETIVGSIRDRKRLEEIFNQYHPRLVYHAAAHKHVPMMEGSPIEAVKNNIFGTINTAYAAFFSRTERFILISTDKAVNPTNIMGATKRVAEMVVQLMSSVSHTRFAAVRFGNVLGSTGSVVPMFKKQILSGGPVTVTHPDMQRYFMTIPEAVQLVLEASSMAKGGEIFVLDMGQPVKIYDLACDLIKLYGLKPQIDIKVVFTGTRPGEKLFEEISLAEEDTEKTPNNKIFINKPIVFDFYEFARSIKELEYAVDICDYKVIKKVISQLVPTYKETP